MIAHARRLEGQFFDILQGIRLVKDFVISVNNIVLYVSLAVIWLFAFIAMFTSGLLPALGIFVVGSLGWCIVSGFWFVQSATYEELRKLNANIV